jgi:hypothetical protein
MSELRTQARFPAVPEGRGHYESFYLRACRPGEGRAIWIRHTVHKRPGERPVGSLWVTLFDAAAGGPVALKQTLAPEALSAAGPDYIRIGESRFGPGQVEGGCEVDGRQASWSLRMTGEEPPLRHLPREVMYRAPIPRTKLLSPHPAIAFDGVVEVDGRRVELDAWPGMVGHNWGAEHAERWIWLHGAALREEAAGDVVAGWLDVALGRIKVGPLTTPWIANGALSLDGRRLRLGGIERVRSTRVDERPTACSMVLPAAAATVRLAVTGDPGHAAGWRYADPDGGEHHVIHDSIADLDVVLERDGRPARRLRSDAGAAYEIGLRERDHGVPMQPFPDP